ncbi:hypothetical protein VNO77_06887 [Canavalia gladiata]|uniref:Uncharacterized protein n=1 Tax=Canavalia gladiata TaxID=3824 RepID=A0AAN9MCS3_CANGL
MFLFHPPSPSPNSPLPLTPSNNISFLCPIFNPKSKQNTQKQTRPSSLSFSFCVVYMSCQLNPLFYAPPFSLLFT